MDQDWVTPKKPGRDYVSPNDATPETPSWRIVGTDKSARFTFGSRSGTIRYGCCTAFESASELRAFADFVEQNPDFILHSGHHQAPVQAASITTLPDGRIRYDTQPMGEQTARTVTRQLGTIHNGLWVTQTPWAPIPLEHRKWIKNKAAYRQGAESPETADKNTKPTLKELSMPSEDTIARNTILYGPPGTGKTYSTILRAVAIIDGVEPESMEEAKAKWDTLRGEGRIEFVTFHQSYGYEDFVEGIRPVMTDEAAQTPRYEVFDGILKRIALRALGAMLEPKSETESSGFSLDVAWAAFGAQWETEQEMILPIGSGNRQLHYRVTSMDSNAIRGKNKNKTGTPWEQIASRTRMTRLWDKFAQTHAQITGSDVESISDNRGAHFTFIASVYNRLYEMASSPSGTVARAETSPKHAATEYLRRGNDSPYQFRPQSTCDRYVLVIDEINRGNISKIFGELITLIEDDKRIGADLALTVTLPHSRDTFGLPANLFLLGTMNTADKSIALVDVALRRRFEFEELMPVFSPQTCPGLTGEMRTAITRLNQRIVLRKDRDHQIGHAFFRSVGDADAFNRVFARKVVPLLQEYFYGDWESLRWVLGEANRKAHFIVPLGNADSEAGTRNRWQWYRDAGLPLDPLAALLRNYKISANSGDTDGADGADEAADE